MFRIIFSLLLLFAFTAPAAAQDDCRCCKARADGQRLFKKGRVSMAKAKWLSAREFSDAATKCSDLDALIERAILAEKRLEEEAIEQERREKEAIDKIRREEATDEALRLKNAEKKRRQRAKEVFDYAMVSIKAGTYVMGSSSEARSGKDECLHTVSVAAFSIGKTEVTQAQWRAVMGANPSSIQGDDLPVENVSWDMVQKFIKTLNDKTGMRYRLPTEAEWEYAAGGGSNKRTKYAGTSLDIELSKYANFCDLQCSKSWADKNQTDGYGFTSPVANFRPNALGLYDMSGNVWEWCQDFYGPYSGCKTPLQVSSNRVLRGGSWMNKADGCRTALRLSNAPHVVGNDVGFRLAHDQ